MRYSDLLTENRKFFYTLSRCKVSRQNRGF